MDIQLYAVSLHITYIWSLCALVHASASSIFSRVNWETSPVRLRSGHSPTSPRDYLPQHTQCVKASCLNLVSAVTGLMMWQGRSVDAVDVLPVVANWGNKHRGGWRKNGMEINKDTLQHPNLCPLCGYYQAAWKYIHILAVDSAHQAINTYF